MDRKQVFQGGKSESDFRRALELLLASFPPAPLLSTPAMEGVVEALRRVGGSGRNSLMDASQ